MLASLLSDKKAVILKRWFDLIVESYPPDAVGFLKNQKDRFLNPVGYTFSKEIEPIYEEVCQGTASDRLAASLDSIIKIRAVQDFSPSQAVAFVFLLKRAIRDELKQQVEDSAVAAELWEVECRIDQLALLAFDSFAKRREKIHEIRVNEIRARSERLLERLNRIYGDAEQRLEESDSGLSSTKRGNGR